MATRTERDRKHQAKRWADPAFRSAKLAANAAYKATTAGILAQERAEQKRQHGGTARGQ